MDRNTCLCIFLGSFHLLDMPVTVDSCAGANTFSEIEMCRGDPRRTEAPNFNIYAAPEGNVQQCDCTLTMIGDGGRVNFTTITLSPNCEGTLTVPGGSTSNCITTVYEKYFVLNETYEMTFTFNSLDVSKCVTVQTDSSPIRTECTGTSPGNTAYSSETVSATTPTSTLGTTSDLKRRTTTTNTAYSSEPASATPATPAYPFMTTLGRTTIRTTTTNTAYRGQSVSPYTATSTFTTASPLNTKRIKLLTMQSTYHTATRTPEPCASLTAVAITGGVGAGLVILLVVVAVVIFCYRRVPRASENNTGNNLQGEKRRSGQANGQAVISSVDDNDIVSAFPDLSTQHPTNYRASRGSNVYTNDHRRSQTQNRSISDNYNTVTFTSPLHASQRCELHTRTGDKHDLHGYDYLRRACTGRASSVDGDTCSLPPLQTESYARQTESDTYNHLRRSSVPHQLSSHYDTIASAAMFVDDLQSVYSYDRLRTVKETSRV